MNKIAKAYHFILFYFFEYFGIALIPTYPWGWYWTYSLSSWSLGKATKHGLLADLLIVNPKFNKKIKGVPMLVWKKDK